MKINYRLKIFLLEHHLVIIAILNVTLSILFRSCFDESFSIVFGDCNTSAGWFGSEKPKNETPCNDLYEQLRKATEQVKQAPQTTSQKATEALTGLYGGKETVQDESGSASNYYIVDKDSKGNRHPILDMYDCKPNPKSNK